MAVTGEPDPIDAFEHRIAALEHAFANLSMKVTAILEKGD